MTAEGHSGQTPSDTETAATPKPAPVKLSAGKKLVFAVVVTVAIFGILEIVLALAGTRQMLYDADPYVGFSANVPLFVEKTDDPGHTKVVTAKNKRNFFNDQEFDRQKPDGSYRIFCMGGSTTYGRPYHDMTSFAGWLRESLPVADPARSWEVINAGGISYASYRVALLMEELVRYQPDLFIIYTGHNEFLERRTYSSILETPPVIRALGGLLGHSRTYSALYRLARPQGGGGEKKKQATVLSEEVNTLLDQSVGLDAYERDAKLQRDVGEHFQLSLTRMVDIARSAGAKVILVAPASNLRNCTPFKSQHRPGLSREEYQQWQVLFDRAQREFRSGEHANALAILDRAMVIDDRYAQLLFLRGQLLDALGRVDEAKQAYQQALDEDICPLRASSTLLKIVAEIATNKQVPLVDFVALAAENSPDGIPGENLFLDHVHPTIEGHRLLSLAILDEMSDQEIVHPQSSWDDEAKASVKADVEKRLDPAEQGEALINLAQVLNWAGKVEESGKMAMKAVKLLPDNAEAHFLAGSSFAHENRLDEAKTEFQRAVELLPDYARAHDSLGLVHLKQKDLESARKHFERAISIDPNYARSHNNLGLVCVEQNDLVQAAKHFEAAVHLQSDYVDARENLKIAQRMLQQGRGR